MGSSLDPWHLSSAPYYRPVGNEVRWFEAMYAKRLPVMLKGPTGCGKTRFVEYMAWQLQRPLLTVACHEDLGAGDLVGRWLLDPQGTQWQDGPLALAARHGAILYLDELVEARAETSVVIHPLADTRRSLPVTATGDLIHAHPDFALVVSFNPGALAKELKPATRQRFCAIEFAYPAPEVEAEIVCEETGVAPAIATTIVGYGIRTRRLQGRGVAEGASTRMLVHAALLVRQGLDCFDACLVAIVHPLGDEAETTRALVAVLEASC